MKRFLKIVKNPLIIFTEKAITEVWQGPLYTCEWYTKKLFKKLTFDVAYLTK